MVTIKRRGIEKMTPLWNKIFTKQTKKPTTQTCGTFMGLKSSCLDYPEEGTAIEYSNALIFIPRKAKQGKIIENYAVRIRSKTDRYAW